MSPLLSAIVLGLIAAGALWRMRGIASRRGPRIVLMLLSLAALQLSLHPPSVQGRAPVLNVLTEGAEVETLGTGEGPWVRLPEAADTDRAQTVPDLATALRRFGPVRALRVHGHGLSTRDLEAARGLPLTFVPAAEPRGLVELSAPPRVAAGAQLRINGRVHATPRARVELRDATGAVRAQVAADETGRFELRTASGPVGRHLRELRVLGDSPEPLETRDLAYVVEDPPPLRVMVLGGAPGPELKFLRRWIDDAGLQQRSRIALRPDLEISDTEIALDAQILSEIDLLILDERSLSALSAEQRGLLTVAIDRGLGLLLRITGPLDETASAFVRAQGFSVQDSNAPRQVVLPAAAFDMPVDETGPEPAGPALTRRPISVEAVDAPALLIDDTNEALGRWRMRGQGRVGLWWLSDSFRLVLAGHADVHARVWAEVTATLARAEAAPAIRIDTPRTAEGQAVRFCALEAAAELRTPSSAVHRLIRDERGCATAWPASPGWHSVRDGARSAELYVYPQTANDSLAQMQRQRNTHALSELSPAVGSIGTRTQALPSWPFLLLWWVSSGLLWWIERDLRRAAPARIQGSPESDHSTQEPNVPG